MLGSKARHRRGLLPLLALLLLASPVQAQLPDTDLTQEGHYTANLAPAQSSVTMEFLGSAEIPIAVEDASIAPGGGDSPREKNRILLSAELVGNNTDGWAASLNRLMLPTSPGEEHQVRLNIQAGAQVEVPTVEVRVTAVYDPITGEPTTTNASVMAVAESFPRLSMRMAEMPEDFTPDEMQQVPITISNNNYYPDMVSFRIDAPEDWMVSPPSSIRLAPGETKTVYVDVKAPENPWFLMSKSSDMIIIDAVSETNGQPLVTSSVPVAQSGSNFPAWAAPHALLLLFGFALITKRTVRKVRDRRLEKGKPSFPGLDPEHEAEFEAMKIEDPAQAEVLEDRLETLYEQRKDAWKQAYKQRREAEDAIQEVYEERHAALVDARERVTDGDVDAEQRERRRELLQRKRALLERKRQRLQEAGEASEDPDREPAGAQGS